MVGKEYLGMLNIKNIYFTDSGGLTSLLRIVNIDDTKTTVITDSRLPQNGRLVIDLINDSQNFVIFVSVVKDFSENNTFTLFYEDPLPETFSKKINKLNSIIYRCEKRKFLRYEVGLKNWKTFGLVKPEVFFMQGSDRVKCIINNASINGVLLTGLRSHIKIGDKVIFTCSFFDTYLKQPAVIINASCPASSWFRYSLRFLEPLNINWCNHILDYSEYLENLLYSK